MRKVTFLCGASLLLFFIMTLGLVTGRWKINLTEVRTISSGNDLYSQEKLDEAKGQYEKLLPTEKDVKPIATIAYNLGLVAYRQQNYEEAIKYWEGLEGQQLNLGNAKLKLGESTKEPQQKMDYLVQAKETYLAGMKIDSANIELKYNYEYVEKLIKELEQQQQENQQQDQQDQDNQDKNEDQDNKNNQENQENQNNQDSQDNQNNQENQQNQDGNKQEESQQDKQNQEQQENKNQEQGENQEQKEMEEQNGTQKGDQQEQGEEAREKQVINQILKMLEEQEAQSLKNNQKIKNAGKEGKYDW